ncbi:unnamed protein product, partial [Closterium sp. NIES-54]
SLTRLAIRNHLPATKCAHFGEHKTAQALYDAVVACYSSPATAAICRLLLPYLFPELSAFATVADLVTHLRTSDARYRATVPAEFLPTNQPPMFITLYFIVTRLPDSLRSVRDHFLTLDPTSLTVDLLEQHLLAAETSAIAVGAARGTPRSPFFEGCSPSLLSPSFTSAAAVDVSVPKEVSASSTSAKRRNNKGKGGQGGGGSGGGGGGSGSGSGGSGRGGGGGCGGGGGGTSGGGGGSGGSGGGRGGSGGSGGGRGGSGGSGGSGTRGGRFGPRRTGPGGGRGQHQQCRSETQTPQQLHEWLVQLGTVAAALGASASGTAPAESLHTFTLDSGASCCFFRGSTTLTPLLAPIPVRLGDPSGGPVVACSSTVLPFPAVPSSSLSGLHLPSFSTNLVSTSTLQVAMVTTTTPRGQRVSICSCTQTRRHLATFIRRPGSSLYTLATEPPQVAASAQVSVSGQVTASCSCRLMSHQTLLWHRRLGHPTLPRIRGMHSSLLVSGLPRSLPPLPPSPTPLCLPCVEGRQRAAPHSSFPPTIAPLQTLHMDVWGPARISGQGRERYILQVVDDYTRYTTVFPLSSKGEVSAVLIPWIRTFSSDLLRDFCREEGIRQSFTLPDSPQQNGIAERRIGLVMEVACTSIIHATAPHFLWPFAVQYAAHQLNLWPRVSLPETSPTVRWTGKVGDASVFQVWGSRAFVSDTSADKLSTRATPCDVTFDESVPFYCLFPYRSAPPVPPPLFLAPSPPPVDPLPPQGHAPSGVSQVDPLSGIASVQVAVVSGDAPSAASGGAASGGAEPGGAGFEGAGSGGAEPEGVEPGGAESEGADRGVSESEGAESGGAEPRGAASSRGPSGVSPRLSSQQLREWLVQCAHHQSGAPGAGEPGNTGAGGATVTTGAGDPTEPGAAGAGGARAGVAGVGGPGAGGPGVAGAVVGGTSAGGAGAVGARAVDPGAGGAGGTVRPRPYFVPLLQQVLGVPSSTGLPPPFRCPPPDQSQPQFQPASPLPTPSPYIELSKGLTERREPASRPVSRVHTARHAPRSRPPPVPGTHAMALRPSSVPLPCAASPIIARLLATAVTQPSLESSDASALVVELLDFAAACTLDYAFAESVSASPPSVG